MEANRRLVIVTVTRKCDQIADRYARSGMAQRMHHALEGLTDEQIRTILNYFEALNAQPL